MQQSCQSAPEESGHMQPGGSPRPLLISAHKCICLPSEDAPAVAFSLRTDRGVLRVRRMSKFCPLQTQNVLIFISTSIKNGIIIIIIYYD